MLVFCGVFLGIGAYLFLNFFITKKVTNDLKLINVNVATGRNRSETVKLVADFIETHSFLKKLSVFRVRALDSVTNSWFCTIYINTRFLSLLFRYVDDFESILQIPFVITFIWSLVTICIAMLLIQMQIVMQIVKWFSVLLTFARVELDLCYKYFRSTEMLGSIWTQPNHLVL